MLQIINSHLSPIFLKLSIKKTKKKHNIQEKCQAHDKTWFNEKSFNRYPSLTSVKNYTNNVQSKTASEIHNPAFQFNFEEQVGELKKYPLQGMHQCRDAMFRLAICQANINPNFNILRALVAVVLCWGRLHGSRSAVYLNLRCATR